MSGGRPTPGGVLCVTHTASATTPDGSHVLELYGALTPAETDRLAARLVERHHAFSVLFTSRTGSRHTLTLVPRDTARGRAPLSPELLADVLLLPVGARTVPLSGTQRARVRAAVRAPDDPGRHVEQVALRWTGPLDPHCFVAAWQSVAARESVLRSAFDWVATPRLVLHDHADIDVVHRPRAAIRSWNDLLEHDRAQGFVLNRAGLLRLTLLEDAPSVAGASVPCTRVLLTYHRALLDERAVHVLLRAFYRAYLAGGPLPGGERRPDVRDHARWLAGQSPDAARAYWSRAAPPPDAAVSPGRPCGSTRQSGDGRIRRRLSPAQVLRLRSWATARGAGESSALHMVWALLLHRAAGARVQPGHVTFGVRLSGRDVALPGAVDVPGLLGGCAPLTVTVDPAEPLEALIRRLRDAALDMANYPWVSDELLSQWTGRGVRSTDTTVDFDSRPPMIPAVRAELEAQGVRVDVPRLVGGTGAAVTLVARHEPDGSLGLTSLYDRAVLRDADAALMLSQCVRMLRALADLTDVGTTVAQFVRVLDGLGVPRAAVRPPGTRPPSLTTLRRGEPGADVICLVAQEGVVPGAYDRFARLHEGPERIVELRCQGPPLALPSALVEAVRGGGLLLCGCGPGAVTAYEIARTVAAGRDAIVVMAGTGSAEASADALAAGLRSVVTGRT
ncbi:condensation domain-containing protein [Streptomyces sp. NBC_00316]|uniref:condensation domain-containing protein n=1 Tax=Streptomyces sp. NBC_00316 TaxID=2975710 RepID=UPI002E2A59F2|nr:condensation domain-containing protein [Streptomyces sp. NBC_00316]